MLVIANAFIFVFERFLSRYLQTLPPGLRLEEQLLYGVHAVMILVTFTVGVLLVPSLTSSIFSGRSGRVRHCPATALVRRPTAMRTPSLSHARPSRTIRVRTRVLFRHRRLDAVLRASSSRLTTCSAGGERRSTMTQERARPYQLPPIEDAQAPVRRALRLGAGDEHVPQDCAAVRVGRRRRAPRR